MLIMFILCCAYIFDKQGGNGYARKITYEDIILEDAKNPVIIIQNYSDDQFANAVKVSDITVKLTGIDWNWFELLHYNGT